jgi:acyl carrier protein
MLQEAQIEAIVFRAIDRTNELLMEEQALPKNQSTALLGNNASLDSMGFVNFVVALEEEYQLATGDTLGITERLNSANGSAAVSTVGDLIRFIQQASQK